MRRTFDLLDEPGHMVQGKPRPEIPEIADNYLTASRLAAVRRLASPRRSVSLTISRNGRPARRASASRLAATSSSRVSVVRMS